MTRVLLPVLLLLTAPLLLPGAAADPCPTYTHRVSTADYAALGAGQSTAEFNEQGQVKLTLVKGNFYVMIDEVASDDWIVSYHVYQEYNGQGGLQRYDDYCQDAGQTYRSSDFIVG